MNTDINSEAFKLSVSQISDSFNGDIFLFSGEISYSNVDSFINIIRNKADRKRNCGLILTTFGGDPNAGYRMARAIKRYYEYLILYSYGFCKSTGTLIALAADQIVMGDFGEFGPLDIQLTKEDELSNTSGLSYLQSLSSLSEHIFSAFEGNFLSLKEKSSFTITTKTAAEIGSKLATGLIAPISAQLDPVKLGEVQRAMSIAQAYGNRLCEDRSRVSRLIGAYPSHDFVIDFEEAKSIFGDNVRFVNQHEAILERLLDKIVRVEPDGLIIQDLLELVEKDNKMETDLVDPNPISEIKPNESYNKEEEENVIETVPTEQNHVNGSSKKK